MTSLQNRYNILSNHDDSAALKLAQLNHVGFLAYSPLARGVLTGRVPQWRYAKNSRALKVNR